MMPNSYVDIKHVYLPKLHEIDKKFYVLNYGTGAEIALEEEVSSATEPLKYYDTLTKGTVYLAVSESSSSINVVIPEIPWFANDRSAKILVYQSQIHPPEDLTWINFVETFPPKWAVEERYDRVFDRVGQLINLAKDWDSYDGNVIEEHCISHAFEVLEYLIKLRERTGIKVPVPFVAPLSSGGIQIEWEEGERYLELDFLPESFEIEYFASDRTNAGELSLEGSMKSLSNLEELLVWFITGEAEDLGYLNFENFYEELIT